MTDRDPHLYAIDTYEDITTELEKAAASLRPAELAREPNFKLADALNAFEIGSDRMDNGSNYLSLADELAKGAAPPIESEKDFVQIADSLVAMEMAWHRGHSPVETVFACLYVEKELTHLTKLRDQAIGEEVPAVLAYLDECLNIESWSDVLRVYIIAQTKTMSLVNQLIETQAADVVFPEEDFIVISHAFYLLDQTPVGVILKLLERAQKFVKSHSSEAMERLVFRLGWLNIVRQRVSRRSVHIDSALKSLDAFTSTLDAKFDHVYSVGIQTRVPCGSVTHPLVKIPLKEAVDQWRVVLEAIKDLARVFGIEKSADMLGFFLVFSTYEHLAVVRAMARCLFANNELLGQHLKQWVLRDIEELSLPEVGAIAKAHKTSVDAFLGQAALCYADLLTSFCQNRCRMREGLIACGISFDSLQLSAEELDRQSIEWGTARQLRGPNNAEAMWALEFSSWTYLRKLQIMLWVVLMAFETDILQQGEYAYTYWYAVQLTQLLLNQLSRMKTYFEQHSLRSKYHTSYGYLVALELEGQTLAQLCTAQYLLWAALEKLKFVQPLRSTGGPDLRYQLRFAPFQSIGVPEQFKLEDYRSVDKELTISIALQGAGNAARGARSLLNTLGQLTQENRELVLLKRSALGLGIAVTSALKPSSPDSMRVEIERQNYHWYFPVPKLVAK